MIRNQADPGMRNSLMNSATGLTGEILPHGGKPPAAQALKRKVAAVEVYRPYCERFTGTQALARRDK
jgi:hypothetical protein